MVDLQAPKGRKIEDAGLDACEAGGRQFARRREHDLNLLPVDGQQVEVVLATARELAASGFAGVEPGIFYFAPFRGLKIHHDGFRVIVTTRSKS